MHSIVRESLLGLHKSFSTMVYALQGVFLTGKRLVLDKIRAIIAIVVVFFLVLFLNTSYEYILVLKPKDYQTNKK